jgi:hypothetical protein
MTLRIRLWNAFASNNSGSYTIVGSFSSPDAAAHAARDLAELCRAESGWRLAKGPEPQPLAEFARAHALAHNPDETVDDWPEDDDDASVVHTDRQVVVHVAYTVTMPRLIGQFLYARGGRVDTEIDHAHHPIVCDLQFWPRWSDPARDAHAEGLRTALDGPDGLARRLAATGVEPVLLRSSTWHDAPVRLLIVLANLTAGVKTLADAARDHSCEARLRCLEAEAGDPLRPWRP